MRIERLQRLYNRFVVKFVKLKVLFLWKFLWYPTWGAYCISKAAFNILSSTLSKEEQDIFTVSLRPGVVDTNMQELIRTKVDVMPDDFYKKFKELKERNELSEPEQPAKAIARLVLFPIKELNGQFVQWDSIDVSALK